MVYTKLLLLRGGTYVKGVLKSIPQIEAWTTSTEQTDWSSKCVWLGRSVAAVCWVWWGTWLPLQAKPLSAVCFCCTVHPPRPTQTFIPVHSSSIQSTRPYNSLTAHRHSDRTLSEALPAQFNLLSIPSFSRSCCRYFPSTFTLSVRPERVCCLVSLTSTIAMARNHVNMDQDKVRQPP